MDTFIADRFNKFFAVRAEIFEVLRKKPVEVSIQDGLFC